MDTTLKTGTTCIGFKFRDGIILAADNRVTSYKINADNFRKIFKLSDNIVATISGGVADAQRFVRAIQGELILTSYKNERTPYVLEAAMILTNFQYSAIRTQGSVVGMLMAGYDKKNGLQLIELGPDGSVLNGQDAVTSGSGSIYVDGVLSTQDTTLLSQKEALELLDKCFISAFKNDNASGGGYIVNVITPNGVNEVVTKSIEQKLVDVMN